MRRLSNDTSDPTERFARRLVSFLTDPEVDAVALEHRTEPSETTNRDHTLIATAVQTGLRASELIGLRTSDVHLGVGPHISCLGKGRKQRDYAAYHASSGTTAELALRTLVNQGRRLRLHNTLQGGIHQPAMHSNTGLQVASPRLLISASPCKGRGSFYTCFAIPPQ